MNINDFHNTLKEVGSDVTLTRPSTDESITVTMGGPGTVRDEALLMDADQSDEQVVMCAVDFTSPTLIEPKRGDRIVDVDSTTSSIQQVRKMWGQGGSGRSLYGWKIRIRG